MFFPAWTIFYVWVGFVFLIGAAVGSFINVCVARLPFEKSILWPGSRCGKCFQPIRARDNLPLIGYWLLRGKCRSCGQPFSISYFFVELFTACAFAGLFYLEIGCNVLDLPLLRQPQVQFYLDWGVIPWQAWIVFFWHATLVGFLITTSLCDLQYLEVPLSVTVCGTIIGLVGATFLAWPFPRAEGPAPLPPGQLPPPIESGLYPWPVWPWRPDHFPAWMPPGSWQLGLATGLAGALAGMATLRAVRFLFGLGRGKEGLGIGDADVMMMAGSFIGWQPTLVAFFVGVFAALFFGIVQLIRRGDQALPFGPALAVGAVITLLTWPTIGRNPNLYLLFSEAWLLGGIAVVGAAFLLLASFILRIIRGPEPPEPSEGQEQKAGAKPPLPPALSSDAGETGVQAAPSAAVQKKIGGGST
jgi:leader peptidase (prepilin peptidase)/N-methyltransferase